MTDVALEGPWPDWHVEEPLGSGSYGTVYRLARTDLGHVSQAAAKLIEVPGDPAELAHLRTMGMDEDEIRAYLKRVAQGVMDEVSVMESLKGSSNVVAIEDYRLVERRSGMGWSIWIRMELLESLVSYVSRKGPLDVDEVVGMGIDLCRALERCHGIGVAHRDVKPENVFRDERFGDFKLGDFGIAKSFEGTVRSAYSQKGTPMYVAPEIALGGSFDERSDIYSLGIMLYRFLNGMRYPLTPDAPAPITPTDLQESLRRRQSGEALPPPRYADPKLSAIVIRACDVDPDKRQQTASKLREELEAWRDRSLAKGETTETEKKRSAKRTKALAVLLVALGVALVFALGANVQNNLVRDLTSGDDSPEGSSEFRDMEGEGTRTLEDALEEEGVEIDLSDQDAELRKEFERDYPEVSVFTKVSGNLIDTTISLGRELTKLEMHYFQVWLHDSEMAESIAQNITQLEEIAGVRGIRQRYTVLEPSSAVVAQATFDTSGIIRIVGMELGITLEDAMGDSSISSEVEKAITETYEEVDPDYQVWVSAQGNELKIMLRSDKTADELDTDAASANARSDEQVQRLSSIAGLLEETFHIEGITVRLTLCDNRDYVIDTVTCSRDGLIEN